MWLLPISILVATTILAIPLSRYLAWIMNGKYHAPAILRWFERRVDSGPQTWIQYTLSMLIFNTVLFVFGFAVLSLQPLMPFNSRGLGMLEPTTILHTAVSFMTNTDLQHYSGDQAFSNFTQLLFLRIEFLPVGLDRFLRADGDYPVLPGRSKLRRISLSICGAS